MHMYMYSDCLGCAVFLCIVVCLTLLTSFFCPSHLSLKHVQCIYIHVYTVHNKQLNIHYLDNRVLRIIKMLKYSVGRTY